MMLRLHLRDCLVAWAQASVAAHRRSRRIPGAADRRLKSDAVVAASRHSRQISLIAAPLA
jgi:hypothetical protein